jgi:hypothetical protein
MKHKDLFNSIKKSGVLMKNPIERKLFRIMAYAFFPTVIALFFSACKADTTDADTINSFVGTWNQTTRIINGATSSKDSTRLLFQINSNNICLLCDSTAASVKAKTIVKRSGWSYNSGLLNLAIDMPASWKVTTDASTLNLERTDFKTDGTISKTVLIFTRVANIDIK